LQLRDLGNTVIVVEHDPQTMMASDWIVDIGPGAGKHGGKVVFEGTPKQILKSQHPYRRLFVWPQKVQMGV
jgi:excinuclease ABC subunit A